MAYAAAGDLHALYNPASGERDILVSRHQSPDLEYVEYNRDVDGAPDYRFDIHNMNALINGESEFEGKLFYMRNSNTKARIQCRIMFSDIRLSLAVFPIKSSSSRGPTEINTKLVAIIKRSGPLADDIVLTCDVQRKREFDRFYVFCNFVYAERMKIDGRNTLSIDLYAQFDRVSINTAALRWQVDCSNMDIMNNLGVTPIFYADPRGFQVQVRLFLRSQRVTPEFRILTGIDDMTDINPKFSIELILINRVDQRFNVVHLFNFQEWFRPEVWNNEEFMNEFSIIREIADVEQVWPLLRDGKLMAKVKLIYVAA